MLQKGMYGELPPDCLAWENLMCGSESFAQALACPDEWIPVFALTVPEVVMVAFGVHLSVLDATPYAIRYDSASATFLAYPLYRMPLNAGLPTSPEAWRDIWSPLIGWFFSPFGGLSRLVGGWMTDASEVVRIVSGQLWLRIRRTEERDEHRQVREA